jgi:RND family efflux transporter MFP subunit
LVLRAFAFLLLGSTVSGLGATDIQGFTEPYRSVNVASPEQGIVTKVLVRVGEKVTKDQPIAVLDDEIHQILFETARERKDARGKLESAEAELSMRLTRLEKLQELFLQGFGRREEVQRANADHEIAQAALKTAREDLVEDQWEFKKIEAELARRVIRAPIDGVVTARLKEPGEYVAPNEPNVIEMVEIDQLLAKFPMKPTMARTLRLSQQVNVRFEGGRTVQGVIDEISPVVDAQSGTIKVKVRIDNRDNALLSGERCSISLLGGDSPNADEPIADDDLERSRKVAVK